MTLLMATTGALAIGWVATVCLVLHWRRPQWLTPTVRAGFWLALVTVTVLIVGGYWRYQPDAMFGSLPFYEMAAISVPVAVIAFCFGWSLATLFYFFRGARRSVSRIQLTLASVIIAVVIGYFPFDYWQKAGSLKDLSVQHIRYTDNGWSGFTLHGIYHYESDTNPTAVASLLLPVPNAPSPRPMAFDREKEGELSIRFHSDLPKLVTARNHELYVLENGRWQRFEHPIPKEAVWRFFKTDRSSYSLNEFRRFFEQSAN